MSCAPGCSQSTPRLMSSIWSKTSTCPWSKETCLFSRSCRHLGCIPTGGGGGGEEEGVKVRVDDGQSLGIRSGLDPMWLYNSTINILDCIW